MADHDTISALRAQTADLRAEDEARSAEMRVILRDALLPSLDAVGFDAALGAGASALGMWGQWRYGERAAPATSARGAVTLSNTSGTAHAFAAGELVLEHGTTGAKYRNVTAGTLPAGSASSPGTLELTVEAEEPGNGSTAAPGAISILSSPLAGVSVTNPAALLGSDADDEQDFRVALKNADELSVGVRQARRADGTLIGATRAVQVADDELRVATATGGDLSAGDLALIPDALELTDVDALNATDVAIAVSYSLEVVDVDAPASPTLEATIESALAAYLATLPLEGAIVRVDALDTVIRAALGLTATSIVNEGSGSQFMVRPLARDDGTSALVSLSVTAPAVDVAPSAGQVPVLGTVTPTITRS